MGHPYDENADVIDSKGKTNVFKKWLNKELKVAYSKKELIERLIEFKSKYGRYPTRKDFNAKKITPSKTTFYRFFRSVEDANKKAELYGRGELTLEDEQEIKPIKSVSKKGSFPCPFCGNLTSGSDKHYSTMTKTIAMRFINLLKSKDEQSDFNTVMDCIHEVFGRGNPVMREALRLAEYLEKFEKRYEEEEQDSGSQVFGKQRCYKCGKLKDDWDITVDTDTKFCKPICEDCLSNSKNRKRGNTNK